jgi:hypothetical protein
VSTTLSFILSENNQNALYLRTERVCFRPCLDAKYFPKFHYAKRRFPITSKYRHMHGVLNVDEIKN